MRLSTVGNLVTAIVLDALLWLAAPVVVARPLERWEVLVVAAAIFALLELWRGLRLRREREQTESLRDSALW